MAEIFLASVEGEAGFHRKVIIKKILPHHAGEAEFVRRLVDEGLLAARLHHGNIVQVLDLGKLGADYFIAMEFVDGVDLRNVLTMAEARKAAVPVHIAVHILWQVARALSYAHDKTSSKGEPLKIVHRDVSPANVFVSWEGSVKLGDFGIAKASQRLSSQTMTGVLQGKFPYMSPEQADGGGLDQRSDIFSFGCMAYELVTGRRPFLGDSDLQVLARIREGTFAPLRSVRPDLPEELEQVIHACLKKDPAQRYVRGEPLERALAGLMQKRRFVVTERDLAAFLTDLYGADKRSLASEMDEAPPADARVVEASPLDPVLLQAGLPITGRVRRDTTPPPERTRSVMVPSWNIRQRRSRRAWAIWTGAMALCAVVLILDYFAFNLVLGPKAEVPDLPEKNTTQGQNRSPAVSVPEPVESPTEEGSAASAVGDRRPPEEEKRLAVPAPVPGDSPPALTPAPESSGVASPLDVAPEKTGTTPAQREIEKPRSKIEDPPESPGPDVTGATSAPEEIENPKSKIQDRSVTKLTVLPADALVYVDGELLGQQPQRVTTEEGGRPRRIRLERAGYRDVEFGLSHPSPRVVAKRLEPVAVGKLVLRYFPASATVLVDGTSVVRNSGLNIIEMELAEGEHLITVQGADKEVSRKVQIKGGEEWRGTVSAGEGTD